MLVEGPDVAVGATVEELELLVLGHLLAEPHAAVAEDAALAVDPDQRRERYRLAVALRVRAVRPGPSRIDVLAALAAASQTGQSSRWLTSRNSTTALCEPLTRSVCV